MTDLTAAKIESALQLYGADILQFSRDLVAIASKNSPGRQYEACVGGIIEELGKLNRLAKRSAFLFYGFA